MQLFGQQLVEVANALGRCIGDVVAVYLLDLELQFEQGQQVVRFVRAVHALHHGRPGAAIGIVGGAVGMQLTGQFAKHLAHGLSDLASLFVALQLRLARPPRAAVAGGATMHCSAVFGPLLGPTLTRAHLFFCALHEFVF